MLGCLGITLGIMISCSHNDEPDEHKSLEKETLISEIVKDEFCGAFSRTQFKCYARHLGQSEWREREISPNHIGWEATSTYMPNLIIFQNGVCLVEFLSHIPNARVNFSMLLFQYWEAYCKKTGYQYHLFIQVPFEYLKQENTLKLGRMDYTIESDDAEKFTLAKYSEYYYGDDNTNVFNEKLSGSYEPDVYPNVEQDLMLTFASYEELHDDVIHRLKDAFGEEGQLDTAILGSKNVKFEELEKEMAEMAYECPYWFAPKPAWR